MKPPAKNDQGASMHMRPSTHSAVAYESLHRMSKSSLGLLLIAACCTFSQAMLVSAFSIPGGLARHHIDTSKGILIHEWCRDKTLHSHPHQHPRLHSLSHPRQFSYVPSHTRTQTYMLAKETNNEEGEGKSDNKNLFNRVVSRMVSSVKGDKSSGSSDGSSGAEDDKKDKRKKWLAAFTTSKSDDDVNGSDVGDTTITPVKAPPPKARAQSSMVAPNILDPFKSEIALSNELKKQKALENYVASDGKKIPEEFLPEDVDSKSDILGLDQALSVIDDSLSFVRGQLSTVRLNEDDDSNTFFLTPKKEEQRLNQIRRDLEIRRREIIKKEEQLKRDKQAKEKAQAAKIRIAAEKAKREREEQKAKQYQMKARELRQKNINMAAKGQVVEPVIENEDDKDTTDEEEDVAAIDESQKKRYVGDFVDGVMASAQSTIGTAWQTIKATTKKADEDDWITVCPKTRISPGEVYPVVAGGLDLLIIGSKDGTKVHCISNSCSHLGTPLETGMIERRPCPKQSGPTSKSYGLNTNDNTKRPVNDGFEECIVCPLHKTAFALDTGEVRGEWCPHPPILGKVMGQVKAQNNLTTFQMRSRGKMLQIKITSKLED